MSVSLVPELPGFDIEKITCLDNRVIVEATAVREEAQCPICGTTTSQIHSHYIRTPADLPYGGKSVQLRLTVRRFFCPNLACYRKTFAERLPEMVPVKGQRTQRAKEALTEVAFACGGELGARLSAKLGMGVSPDTLIRLIRSQPEPEQAKPHVVAVDDWAKRKGRGLKSRRKKYEQAFVLTLQRISVRASSLESPQISVDFPDRACKC